MSQIHDINLVLPEPRRYAPTMFGDVTHGASEAIKKPKCHKIIHTYTYAPVCHLRSSIHSYTLPNSTKEFKVDENMIFSPLLSLIETHLTLAWIIL